MNQDAQPATRKTPVPAIGFRIATAIAFAWGFLWSRGAVVRHQGMWVFRGMPPWTFGRGGTCVGACFLTGAEPSPALLRHELVHVDQWRHYGLLFPFLYFKEGIHADHNRFEVEAGLADGGYREPTSRPR